MQKTLIATLLVVGIMALAACSSSVGTGSEPPHDTTVVVPPGSSVTTP